MSERVCLRCDWSGETDGHACPRCGVVLYRLGDSEPAKPRDVAGLSRPRPAPAQRSRGSYVAAPPEDEWVPQPTPTATGHRWVIIVLAFTVAVAGMALGFIRGDPADPAASPGGIEGIDDAGAATDIPAPDAVPGTSPPAAPTGPTGSGPCPDEPAGPIEIHDVEVPGLEPESVEAAVTADYRFQHTLASSVGTAPDLVEVGRGISAFSDEGIIGRTVLTFARGRGLSLTPTTGVIDREEYTIELLFRFDELGDFRKIVDFKNGSSDNGLYSLQGCLNIYPRPPTSPATIEEDEYVLVVLTRDADATLVGYVNGVRQFTFRDTSGFAVIDERDTLGFFRDDLVTVNEYSGGAVSRIRLYDRPLTAVEVAVLACAELPINIDPRPCQPQE